MALDRPFAAGALPPALRAQGIPLLAFLERADLPYDLTTDVSLARARGPILLWVWVRVGWARSRSWLRGLGELRLDELERAGL